MAGRKQRKGAVVTTHPPRRILSIWLPRLSIDRWRQTAPDADDTIPTALVSDGAHGPRIVAVNGAARQAGVRVDARLADMRALCPNLTTFPHDPAADRALLEAMALWAQRWGPWSALDPPDGLLVDTTGAAHLFDGEQALTTDVAARLAARGYAATTGMAATAGAAWALSHYAPGTIIPSDGDPRDWLDPLPVAALRLDDDVRLLLRRLGLKRIGDIRTIARDALARRFRNRRAMGANPLIRMDQLLGVTAEPLLPVHVTETPLVQRRLMEPLLHRSLLDRIVADLADDMARVLESRREGARRLVLRLFRIDGLTLERRLELASASRDAAHIARLFAGKLDDIDAGFGIDQVQMLSPWVEPLLLMQDDLDGKPHPGTTLAACIDRLSARLGAEAVTRPLPHPSHKPERSQRWIAPLATPPPSQSVLRLHARPLKLLDRAEPIEVVYGTPEDPPRRFRWRGSLHQIARVEGPERIAPEWWRERSTARLRDYYLIEDEAGRRYWIYRAGLIGDGRGGAPDWFLQGMG